MTGSVQLFATAVGAAPAIADFVWWVYKRGFSAGIRSNQDERVKRAQAATQAKLEALEQEVSDLQSRKRR